MPSSRCGVGAFLRLVAERGGRPHGIDASEALLEVARARLPDADLRHGDMEALPYDDDSFHLVTGFTSFFFADDIVAAVREAGRVAKPGAAVVITVWGPHEANELEAVKTVIRPYLPPRSADAPPEPDYARAGVLEDIAGRAGLEPETTFDSTWAYAFADAETVRRAMVAPAGLALLVGDREDEVKNAIERGLAPYRADDGGYCLENTFHSLIARAR